MVIGDLRLTVVVLTSILHLFNAYQANPDMPRKLRACISCVTVSLDVLCIPERSMDKFLYAISYMQSVDLLLSTAAIDLGFLRCADFLGEMEGQVRSLYGTCTTQLMQFGKFGIDSPPVLNYSGGRS
jgi:hypothetical protein